MRPTVLEVLLLGRSEVEELLIMSEVLKAIEHSFKLKAEGRVIMPPKLYLDLPEYRGLSLVWWELACRLKHNS